MFGPASSIGLVDRSDVRLPLRTRRSEAHRIELSGADA